MKSKLQTTEKNKREKKEVITSYVWTIITLAWLIFITICSYNFLTDDSILIKERILLVFIINVPTLIFTLISIMTTYVDKFVRYTEFKIYSYERWDNINDKYETLYIVDEIKQYSKFFLHMHLYDYVEYKNHNELEKYCNQLYLFIGYETKEAAMKSILNTVKNIVSNEKEEINVKVRNINSVDTYTINELKQMLK